MDGFFQQVKGLRRKLNEGFGARLAPEPNFFHAGRDDGEHQHALGKRLGIDDDEIVRIGRSERPISEIVDTAFAKGEPEC